MTCSPNASSSVSPACNFAHSSAVYRFSGSWSGCASLDCSANSGSVVASTSDPPASANKAAASSPVIIPAREALVAATASLVRVAGDLSSPLIAFRSCCSKPVCFSNSVTVDSPDSGFCASAADSAVATDILGSPASLAAALSLSVATSFLSSAVGARSTGGFPVMSGTSSSRTICL